jgi:hypothetical protein
MKVVSTWIFVISTDAVTLIPNKEKFPLKCMHKDWAVKETWEEPARGLQNEHHPIWKLFTLQGELSSTISIQACKWQILRNKATMLTPEILNYVQMCEQIYFVNNSAISITKTIRSFHAWPILGTKLHKLTWILFFYFFKCKMTFLKCCWPSVAHQNSLWCDNCQF